MNTQEELFNKLESRVSILEVKYEGIKERLDKIDVGINRLNWLLITGIVLAILNSVLKGGVIS